MKAVKQSENLWVAKNDIYNTHDTQLIARYQEISIKVEDDHLLAHFVTYPNYANIPCILGAFDGGFGESQEGRAPKNVWVKMSEVGGADNEASKWESASDCYVACTTDHAFKYDSRMYGKIFAFKIE